MLLGGRIYLAERVRNILAEPDRWRALPDQVREWLGYQQWRSVVPNARELLWGVRDKLSAHRQVENIKFLAKNSASQPAPKELLQEVAANYKAALLALGD